MTNEEVDRVFAIWLLMRPAIEEKARELGATPQQMALALTIGAPTFIAATAPEGHEAEYLGKAAALFEHCCKAALVQWAAKG